MCILCDNDVDVVDTWAAVCGSAWEMETWWFTYEYEGGDWDDPCTLWVAIIDPENEYWDEFDYDYGVITATFTVEDMIRALEELRDHPIVMRCLRSGDFDATYGDVVIQQAIFGGVIFG